MKEFEKVEDHPNQDNAARIGEKAGRIHVSGQVHHIGIVACFISQIFKIGSSLSKVYHSGGAFQGFTQESENIMNPKT